MEGLDELFHYICVVGLKYQKESLKLFRIRKICGILQIRSVLNEYYVFGLWIATQGKR
jgi:hypothetical protein